ncbi:MAG: NFACT family protein [Lachnospiraceae bacterium]|nr:NFACT family protein [Lachnospiraceae bacterium]
MAFDGITMAAVAAQLRGALVGGRISKIAQPENDELLLTIKNEGDTYRLLLSADPSLPLVYLTEENKQSPMTAPVFCMLLRKHLQGGRIASVTQPGLERILRFEVEHLDEMGDPCRHFLIFELMGKHSNLIFTDASDRIIDSIHRVSAAVSSVREVLPGKPYFIPQVQDKADLLSAQETDFTQLVGSRPTPLYKAIYGSYTGISPCMAQELCFEAQLDGDLATAAFGPEEYHRLWEAARKLQNRVSEADYAPCIIYEGKAPKEYAAVPLRLYEGSSFTTVTERQQVQDTDATDPASSGGPLTISEVLYRYYREKNIVTRIRQRSSDLRHIVQTALERNVKKYDLQLSQLRDTEKREQYRIYGELLNTYGYGAEPGAKSLTCTNYYTNEEVTIPLDPDLTAIENAKKYFDRYGKLKRTYEALSELTVEVEAQIRHLESILTSLDIARSEEDLTEIRQELVAGGYLRSAGGKRREKVTSKPFHYISSDGYDIYVGKNNFQNDALTFGFAKGGDWWFHAKKIPGSHVILRSKAVGGAAEEIPDRTFEEAARLAAYYSKGREQEKVEIDYVRRKEVKKPAGAKPGFVVYYTNYSMAISSDISGIREVKDG